MAGGWIFAVVYYLSLFGPLFLLGIAWCKLPSLKRRFEVTVLALISLSYCYLMAALLSRSTFLGPDYGNRLFATVETNTAVSFCLFLVAGIRKSSIRLLLALGAFIVTLAWFLVWVVNAAV